MHEWSVLLHTIHSSQQRELPSNVPPLLPNFPLEEPSPPPPLQASEGQKRDWAALVKSGFYKMLLHTLHPHVFTQSALPGLSSLPVRPPFTLFHLLISFFSFFDLDYKLSLSHLAFGRFTLSIQCICPLKLVQSVKRCSLPVVLHTHMFHGCTEERTACTNVLYYYNGDKREGKCDYALTYFSSFEREKKGCSTEAPIKAGFPEWRQNDMFLNSEERKLPGHSFERSGICQFLV